MTLRRGQGAVGVLDDGDDVGGGCGPDGFDKEDGGPRALWLGLELITKITP